MAWLAGDDPDDYDFCYDPFDTEAGDGVGGGPCCFSSPDGYGYDGGDDDDVLVVAGRAPRPAAGEPSARTLGRPLASGGGFSRFFPNPRLVPARGIPEYSSSEEDDEVSGDGRRRAGYALSWFGGGRRPAVEVSSSDDDDDDGSGLGAMLSGFSLDPGHAHRAGEEAAGDGGGVEGLILSGLNLGPPPPRPPAAVGGTFRMLLSADDTDSSDDGGFLGALPASRAAVEGLPEVALGEEEASRGCAVCKDGLAAGERAVRLPCKHCFHGGCIRPWLAIRNTCPVCRFELPTGNAEHDRRRRRADGAPPARQSTPAQKVEVEPLAREPQQLERMLQDAQRRTDQVRLDEASAVHRMV
ncbi:hypothetical protein ACP4OV_009843 [Aristida adscensionis]